MHKFIKDYQEKFINNMNSVVATDKANKKISVDKAVENTVNIIKRLTRNGGRVFFIGNGGSAAIASHMAVDFWKNGRMESMAFNDSSLLTCVGNDFGYEYVFEKPIDFFAGKNDILFAISSSGKSKNILNGVKAAKTKHCKIITFSGFDADNPLRLTGDCNFYAPSDKYGTVEVIHQYICHFILDTILEEKGEQKR
jgi:D-sedoheptulose 7-phosphate isomerase